VAWQFRLQNCITLSTIEIELIATTEACKELLWINFFLQELGFQQQRYVLFCDNLSAIYLGENPTFHGSINILMCGIIGSMMFWTLNYWRLRRFI